MEYLGYAILSVLILLGWYIVASDRKTHKLIMSALDRIRKEQLTVVSEQRRMDISLSDMRKKITECIDHTSAVQEHCAKIREQQRILSRRQSWLKENCVRRPLAVKLPRQFTETAERLAKQMEGLTQ